MKTLRQLCAASVLTLMLTLSAFAGQISTGEAPPPPPPPPTQQVTNDGQISTGSAGQMTTGLAGEISAGFTATEIALSLIQGVLALV